MKIVHDVNRKHGMMMTKNTCTNHANSAMVTGSIPNQHALFTD